MPSAGNNPPQRKGWREGSAPVRAAGAAAAPVKPRAAGWTKKTSDDRYESALLRHRLRVVFWSLLFVGLIGVFFYYVFKQVVRTPLVAFAATTYAAPIPPNAWASEDLAGLRTLGKEGGLLEEKRIVDFHDVPPWESKEQWLRELRRQIDAARPGGPAKNAIIIYLSLHGVVNDRGEACLIPPGVSPWKSGQWVRVRDLLTELFLIQDDNGRYAAKIKGWDKLLVLDCNRIDAAWGLGQFYNDFAERLAEVVREVHVPHLYVLNSTSPGQVAWSAAELRGSVFGYFLAQGLNGAADVESGGNHNKQVSLRELHGYLKAKVNQWVIQNRDDVQEPMLMPDDAADVPLAYRRSNEGTVVPEPVPRDARWDRVAALWKEHDRLRKKTSCRAKPMEWEAFQRELLRAEQLLQAGSSYEREFDDTIARLTSEAAALDRATVSPDAVPYSLALAETWGRLPDAGKLRELPAPWLPAGKAVAEAASPAKPAAKETAKPAAPEKPSPPAPRPRYAYLPAAAAAWNRALEHHDAPDELKEALTFLDGAEGQPRENNTDGSLKSDVVEIQFLRMLAAYLDAKAWDRPDLVGRALRARQLAETAIASPDPVTQYWIANLIDAADAERRLAEDKLYVGSPDALKQAEALWDGVAAEEGEGGKYREAVRRARIAAKALAMRDRAWAESPYLAESLLARLAVGQPSAEALRGLLEGTQRLAILLDETPENDQWPAALSQATAQVEEAMNKLAATGNEECYALRTAADDSHTLRRTLAVLNLPLLSGDERNTLREKSLRIVLARQRSDATTTGAARPETSGIGRDWQERLAQWEKTSEHPALMLLEFGAMAPGEKQLATNWPDDLGLRLAAQGEKARARLGELIARAQQGSQESRVLLAKRRATRPAAIRQSCCNAERALRASAALFAGGPLQDLQVDPIAELRRFDLHELLVWQARRTMEDFWGPRPGGEKPYFEIVARDELRSADKLQRGIADSPEAARLEQLTAAAENVVRPSVEPEKLLIDAPDAEIPQSMTVNIAPGLPRGEAAAFLDYSRGLLAVQQRDNRLQRRRMLIDVQAAGQVRLPEYLIPKDWQAGSQWRAEAFYRGHVRTAAFNFAPLQGVEIAYRPEFVPHARISVIGESKQRTGILFILDCSGSMGEPVDKSNPNSPQKFDVARNALYNVLDLLATQREACRAGMMVYSHRVWENNGAYPQFPVGELLTRNPNNLSELVPVKKLAPPNPALLNLHADTDIEVMDLVGGAIAPLTGKRADEIKGHLDKLNNMGMTPLYLSIMEAVDQLNGDRDSEQKQIIVLTDGVNDQRHAEFRNTCEQLRQRLNLDRNRRIRLDIVGFQINAGGLSAEERKEYNEMMGLIAELQREGRGQFFDANDMTGLMSALRKSLSLAKYEVFRAKSVARVCEPLELNKVCEVKPLVPGPFRVQLADATRPTAADVVLEGGEWLELCLRQNPWGLVHERYERAIRDFCAAVPNPLDAEHTHWIGAHLPKWEAGGVEFHVSLQNGNAAGFSPRPVEAWVEISPLPQPADPNEPKKYVFYDMAFVPDRPVPVLKCLVPRWPKQADEAQIELWCKFRPTIEEEVPLGRLRQFHVSDVPDVRFDVATVRGQGPHGACKVVINEWHPKSGDIHRLKLELQAGASGPVEVHRLYDTHAGDLGLVRHEFYLEGNPSSTEIDSFVVRVVSRERLQKDAVKLPRPLRVTIPR